MCYNITCKSPPMGTGGIEPPRQLPASSCQDYCVCQLHHAPISENSEGASLPAETPSKTSPLKRYHNLRDLSICKSIVDVANKNNKSLVKEIVMAVCPKGYSRDMVKFGRYGNYQKWHCNNCGYTTVKPRQRRPKGHR